MAKKARTARQHSKDRNIDLGAPSEMVIDGTRAYHEELRLVVKIICGVTFKTSLEAFHHPEPEFLFGSQRAQPAVSGTNDDAEEKA